MSEASHHYLKSRTPRPKGEARAIHKQEVGHLRRFSVYKIVAEGRILGRKKARVQSVFYSTPYERILSILQLFFTSGETLLTDEVSFQDIFFILRSMRSVPMNAIDTVLATKPGVI